MGETATLLSLPNEVLIIIFENPKFPVDYLAILAVLCRRLHFLALPIYFARYGMPSPTKSAVVHLAHDGQDMLAALNMALFINSMEDITCIFPHPSCTSVLPLLPHLRRFRKFVSRFPSVNRVTLQLDARNSMCNATGDDKALRAWSSSLEALLNCLVEKRCTEVTVKYGGYLTRSYTLSIGPSKRVRRIVKAIRRLLLPRAAMEGKDWEFQRSRDQGRARALASVPAKVSRSSTLTSLHIQSAVLVMPPCLNWTLSALRHCPITSLSLFQISLEKEIWSAALSLIARAAPNITDLSLSELDSISDVEILRFCSRLTRLTFLKIGANEEGQGTPTKCTKGRVPQFRNLTSLIAPADFVQYFMRPRSCLPMLVSLRILFLGKADICAIIEQLRNICELMAERTLTPTLSLSLSLYSNITAGLEDLSTLSDGAKKCLSHVASLILDVFASNPDDIARWVHIFPAVQHVSLTVKPSVTGAYKDRLVQALSKDRGCLRTIVVNGMKHVLDNLSPSTEEI
ncbi:hypothetical protein MSAN_01172900 [Mycena sanguinolenta]|uniref:F-box domain-containing protein n=1 Tax=Mycena sanguinolenta TaxID=230812 RepID=A0A8H6YHM7_9AGAR|nr:hypothetical protein MSAN_01172900 [Mycena sanguinolenta]